MTQDKISSFKLRITEGNRTEIICILYEIFFAYVEDAIEALDRISQERSPENIDAYGKALHGASQVIRHLEDALDFQYEISQNLYALYSYVERTLAKASYRLEKEDFENCRKVMQPLSESFREVAAQDTSKPMMSNTQKVTAGYTYGRNDVTESYAADQNRGFFA